MAPNLLFYRLLLVALVLICLLTHVWWLDNTRATPHRLLTSAQLRRTRSKEPKPFTGYIHYARPVSREAIPASRRPARHRPSSPSREDADARSTPALTSVPLRIVPTTAGLDAATFARMAIPVASPGASCSVSSPWRKLCCISLRRCWRPGVCRSF
jgi:hypothetical protein